MAQTCQLFSPSFRVSFVALCFWLLHVSAYVLHIPYTMRHWVWLPLCLAHYSACARITVSVWYLIHWRYQIYSMTLQIDTTRAQLMGGSLTLAQYMFWKAYSLVSKPWEQVNCNPFSFGNLGSQHEQNTPGADSTHQHVALQTQGTGMYGLPGD